MPEDFRDENLGKRRQGVFTNTERIVLKKAGLVGSIHKPLQHGRVVIVVHGDGDLGFELIEHFLGILGSHRGRPGYGKEENIHMAEQFKLIFIKGFAHITGVADAETVQFEDKGGPFNILIRGSCMDGDIIDQDIAEDCADLVPFAPA